MTDQPVLTRWDALLPCPFCGKPLYVKRGKVNPAARCLTEDCYGQRMSVVSLDVASDVEAWNTRSNPTAGVTPAPDAAPVMGGDELCKALDLKITDSNGREVAEDSLHELRKSVEKFLAAPPKPAPDAMEAVDYEIERWGNDERVLYPDNEVLDSLERIKAVLSPAPVPSGDGAGDLRELAHQLESADWGDAPGPMRLLALKVCRAIHSLPPSDAGAAEPVAWRRIRDDGIVIYWETKVPDSIPLYAAPPVRGEREAIIRLAEIHLGAWLKSTDPALQLIPTAARQDIRDFADAILSLPSAPVSER